MGYHSFPQHCAAIYATKCICHRRTHLLCMPRGGPHISGWPLGPSRSTTSHLCLMQYVYWCLCFIIRKWKCTYFSWSRHICIGVQVQEVSQKTGQQEHAEELLTLGYKPRRCISDKHDLLRGKVHTIDTQHLSCLTTPLAMHPQPWSSPHHPCQQNCCLSCHLQEPGLEQLNLRFHPLCSDHLSHPHPGAGADSEA